MLYAIRSASGVAHTDLQIAIHNAVKEMTALQAKAAKAKEYTAIEKKAFEAEYAAKSKAVARMVRDSMSTVAQTQTCYNAETQGKIKKDDVSVAAYADQMKANVIKTQAHMAKTIDATLLEITQHEKRA